MFGFFKSKKIARQSDENQHLADVIVNLLMVQIISSRSGSDRLSDDWAIGYIGGFADAVLQHKGIGTDDRGCEIMARFFVGMYGKEDGPVLLKKYVALIERKNVAASDGGVTAGHEVFDLLGGKCKHAHGLSLYCLGMLSELNSMKLDNWGLAPTSE